MNLKWADILKLAAGAMISAIVFEALQRYVFPRILPPALPQRERGETE
jgi:hypothetical protein